MFNNSFRGQQLPKSTRRGKITLIHKKGDTNILKNWRPVSLLNVDYKICSKVLTERLKPHLHNIIHLNQACGISGRSIHDHINLIIEIVDFVENNGLHRGGISVLAVDQSQAFDRVSHQFLFSCLEQYNLGPTFIQWVKTLYGHATIYISINGHKTPRDITS